MVDLQVDAVLLAGETQPGLLAVCANPLDFAERTDPPGALEEARYPGRWVDQSMPAAQGIKFVFPNGQSVSELTEWKGLAARQVCCRETGTPLEYQRYRDVVGISTSGNE
ncbi:hypothetical protein [Dietzia sp. 179-F 9C3 NHS]|uniref:hypothetical protein n=1 Tax=Dietzia sp. 179-F 9C3 NHS TaxID=3374295 RepID=UPI0038798957